MSLACCAFWYLLWQIPVSHYKRTFVTVMLKRKDGMEETEVGKTLHFKAQASHLVVTDHDSNT